MQNKMVVDILSRYDGVENNEEVNDITYYIYKQ